MEVWASFPPADESINLAIGTILGSIRLRSKQFACRDKMQLPMDTWTDESNKNTRSYNSIQASFRLSVGGPI